MFVSGGESDKSWRHVSLTRGVDPNDDGLESGGVRRFKSGEIYGGPRSVSVNAARSSSDICSGAKTLMPFCARSCESVDEPLVSGAGAVSYTHLRAHET